MVREEADRAYRRAQIEPLPETASDVIRAEVRQARTQLEALLAEHEVTAMVLGLPINMDATEGPRAQSTRAFARNLGGRIVMPLLLWDERLSTNAVTRTLIEADMSRKRRAEVVDKMAAGFILQGALDALSRL